MPLPPLPPRPPMTQPPPTDLAASVTVLALGQFDGVHRGHAQVFASAVREAGRRGGLSAALTFEPRVDVVLARPGVPVPGRLTTPAETTARILQVGIRHVAVWPFDHALAAKSPVDFLQLLRRAFPALQCVVAGEDFTFGACGAGHAGNFQELATLADSRRPLDGRFVPAVVDRFGQKVSSTAIREALLAGKPLRATELLGRPYALAGRVVHGRQVGRTRGLPTANLQIPTDLLLPRPGVYAADALLPDGECRPAGTFVADARDARQALYQSPIEAHLLGFSGDLYGVPLTLRFRRYLRPFRPFASEAEAIHSIRHDLARLRAFRS